MYLRDIMYIYIITKINVHTLIGQLATVYCAGKTTEQLSIFFIII